MQLQGDLINFYPPDILTFAASLNKEGILTIKDNTNILTITLKGNFIIDAHSETADKKIIKSLFIYRLINRNNFKYLLQVQQETRLPVREMLDNLNLLNQKKVKQICLNCIREVFFEFFKLKNGIFKFIEIKTGISDDFIKLNPQTIAVTISQWIDETNEFERDLATFQRQVSCNLKNNNFNTMETILANDIGKGISIYDLMKKNFLPSYETIKLLKKMIDSKKIILHEPGTTPQKNKNSVLYFDKYFQDFKNASRKILTSSTPNEKMTGLLNFCKACFNDFFIISAKKDKVVQQIHYFRDKKRALKKNYKKNIEQSLKLESFFVSILKAGASFFGNDLNSAFFKGKNQIQDNAQCAVIPYMKAASHVTFLYVISELKQAEHSPLKYLEILSWMLNPDMGFQNISIHSDNGAESARMEERLGKIAETVNELPPMHHTVTKLLKLLSDPDYDLEKLIGLISQDQSIMAAVIKVSNSVVYRAMDKISTVGEAVKRLGIKSIKGIAIATATRSMFPSGDPDLKDLSHGLWIHSKECGIISRRIAVEIGYSDPDEAFVGGILHDIGKLAILIKSIENFKKVKDLEKKSIPAFEAEKKILGYDHAQVGALLMKKWNMPQPLLSCIKNHHNLLEYFEGGILTNIVSLGNLYSHALETDFIDHVEKTPEAIAIQLSRCGLNEKNEKHLIEKMKFDIKHSDMFD